MSVGILLITHDGIGKPMLAVCERLLGRLPLTAEAFELDFAHSPEAALPEASAALRRVDGGDGVLVLVDVYGASPSRLAARVSTLGTPVRRVSGLGLPMLLRSFNYADQDLDELVRTAAAGGRNGVIIDDD